MCNTFLIFVQSAHTCVNELLLHLVEMGWMVCSSAASTATPRAGWRTILYVYDQTHLHIVTEELNQWQLSVCAVFTSITDKCEYRSIYGWKWCADWSNFYTGIGNFSTTETPNGWNTTQTLRTANAMHTWNVWMKQIQPARHNAMKWLKIWMCACYESHMQFSWDLPKMIRLHIEYHSATFIAVFCHKVTINKIMLSVEIRKKASSLIFFSLSRM